MLHPVERALRIDWIKVRAERVPHELSLHKSENPHAVICINPENPRSKNLIQSRHRNIRNAAITWFHEYYVANLKIPRTAGRDHLGVGEDPEDFRIAKITKEDGQEIVHVENAFFPDVTQFGWTWELDE